MNHKRNSGKYIIAVMAAAAAVFIDQISKYWAELYLKGRPAKPVIEGVFELRYLENRGAAFGMMQNMQYFFVVGALLICAFVIIIYMRIPDSRKYLPLRICAVLLCAGAVGNMIDRVRLNYVIDYFYFRLIDFPIFNVADCYVVAACIGFAFLILFYYKAEDDFAFLNRKKG